MKEHQLMWVWPLMQRDDEALVRFIIEVYRNVIKYGVKKEHLAGIIQGVAAGRRPDPSYCRDKELSGANFRRKESTSGLAVKTLFSTQSRLEANYCFQP